MEWKIVAGCGIEKSILEPPQSVASDIKHSQQLIASFLFRIPMFIFPLCYISGLPTLQNQNIIEFSRHLTWQYKNETLVFRLFLAKNDRGNLGVRVALKGAGQVIPLAFSGSCANYVATFFCYIIRLSSVPVTVACQQCIICPVELVICLSVKSYPYTPGCYFLLLGEEIKDELILRGWCDFSEVSSHLLAISSSVAPLQGWNVDDEETRVYMKYPAVWTNRFWLE